MCLTCRSRRLGCAESRLSRPSTTGSCLRVCPTIPQRHEGSPS
jgi:hypothetical protein